jgi:hypothetical protein
MPLVKAQLVTPDEAVAHGFCPECGKDLTEGNPAAHRLSHWMKAPPEDQSGDEARRRMVLYDSYLKAQFAKAAEPAKPAAAQQEAKA